MNVERKTNVTITMTEDEALWLESLLEYVAFYGSEKDEKIRRKFHRALTGTGVEQS